MPPGPSNIREAWGRLASRRRRSESSSRALPRVSWRSRGAAYKATEARRRRIFADHLMWLDVVCDRCSHLSNTSRTVAANAADALRALPLMAVIFTILLVG